MTLIELQNKLYECENCLINSKKEYNKLEDIINSLPDKNTISSKYIKEYEAYGASMKNVDTLEKQIIDLMGKINNEKENIKEKYKLELEKAQKENLEVTTNDIKKNPYRFRFNLILFIISIIVSIVIPITLNKCEETKRVSFEKSQLQQDSILRKYVSDKYEFLRKNSIKAENDILLLKKQANDSATKPSPIKHLSKP
ncbi:MAG TPA: hypothetical protein VF411_07625 [Bacteroidia bacterium]